MSTVPNTCGSHNFRNGRDPNVLLQHTLLRLVSRPNTKQNKQNKRLGDHVVYPPGYWDINQRRGLLFFRPDVSRTHSSSPSLGDYTPISEGHSTPLRRRKVFKGMRHPDPSPPTRLPVPSLWKDTHSLHQTSGPRGLWTDLCTLRRHVPTKVPSVRTSRKGTTRPTTFNVASHRRGRDCFYVWGTVVEKPE